MKIIILAAGRGERLMPLTQNTPKPLIDMGNGNTLLEEQIMNIQKSGVINEIILVTGYLSEQIEAKMRLYHERGIKIFTVYNPFWKISNNLISLWLTRHIIANTDVMITNGDNIFTPDVFSGLAKQHDGLWLSVSEKTDFDQDDMKVTWADGLITSVSKKIPPEQASGESPGLALIKGHRAQDLFINQLESTVREDENHNQFWLEIFNKMWSKGLPVKPWIFESKGRWQEVDFHVDVSLIRNLLKEKVITLNPDKEMVL